MYEQPTPNYSYELVAKILPTLNNFMTTARTCKLVKTGEGLCEGCIFSSRPNICDIKEIPFKLALQIHFPELFI